MCIRDRCQIALNGKPVSAITNDKRSIANFSMENSTIKITAVTQQFIINTSSNKNQDYGNVIFRNNTFYCPSGKVNQLVLFNGSASGIANLTIENNTFINLETNTGGYVNIDVYKRQVQVGNALGRNCFERNISPALYQIEIIECTQEAGFGDVLFFDACIETVYFVDVFEEHIGTVDA